MIIQRDFYLERLGRLKGNGLVKIITGVRRCGKSFLLFNLFREKLLLEGVDDKHIVFVQLDDDDAENLRTPKALSAWVKSRLPEDGLPTYVLIDEIQMCKPPEDEIQKKSAVTFYDVLNSLMKKANVDVYVTGSNSEMLSRDIATNFRDRGVEIRVWPLSFSEVYAASGMEKAEAWDRYLTWGGLPLAVTAADDFERSRYLGSLFERIYLKDIIERYSLRKDESVLMSLLNVLSSSVGSLTNPQKIANTLRSECSIDICADTINAYLGYFADSFLFNVAKRWDVKGRKYLSAPSKYYAVDLGLRNASLNFRQPEKGHLMENAIYNELMMRGYNVDVGIVETYSKNENSLTVRNKTEIDFVVNLGMRKLYIQSAYAISDEKKRAQEIYSLKHTEDFFRKVVIENGFAQPYMDEDGILYVGVIPFLLDRSILSSIM